MDQEASRAMIATIVKRLGFVQAWADDAAVDRSEVRPLNLARLRTGGRDDTLSAA